MEAAVMSQSLSPAILEEVSKLNISDNEETKGVNTSTKDNQKPPVLAEDVQHCVICMDVPVNEKSLPVCEHVFCMDCIDTWFKTKPTCPSCGLIHGEIRGNQPQGTMTVTSGTGAYTYNKGFIVINYSFPSGTQQACHPHPGQPYSGTSRTAYLPDTEEGKHVLGLLRRAFDARLTFTVGRSATTGRDNQVIWNDIHHKTSMSGGPQSFGYPDPTYLSRVKEELAAHGIK